MGKKTYIGPGPNCPRCRQPSKLYRKSKNNPHSRVSAYCENQNCVTIAFPVNSTRVHSDRIRMGDGPPCPRCLATTTAWKHSDDWTPPANKGYYVFWYQCMNDACTTQQIMPKEAKVNASGKTECKKSNSSDSFITERTSDWIGTPEPYPGAAPWE